MIPFMKDKPKENFFKTPPIPSDIKALAEQRKREEQEKLEKADEAGRTLGVSFNTGTKTRRSVPSLIRGGEDSVTPTTTVPTDSTETSSPVETVKPPVKEDPPKPVIVSTPPPRKPEPQPEKPQSEGAKRKGKKGDGEN
jgi:hypothetical protein